MRFIDLSNKVEAFIVEALRKAERERDAQDLELIMRNYVDAGNFDRVFEQEQIISKIY